MENEMSNILNDYDKFNETVSKSTEPENVVEPSEENIAETAKAENTKPQPVENGEDTGEKVPGETDQVDDTVTPDPQLDPAQESSEDLKKSYKGSEEESEGLATPETEMKDEVTGADVPVVESPEADEVEFVEPKEGEDTEAQDTEENGDNKEEDIEEAKEDKEEADEEKAEKGLSDEQILKGFRSVLSSLETMSETTVTREEFEGITKSIEDMTAKLDAVLAGEEVSKTLYADDVESPKEDKEDDESDSDESVSKSVTTEGTAEEKSEGFVAKSVEGGAEVPAEETEEQEEVQEDKLDIDNLRSKFMDNFKKQSMLKKKDHREMNVARESYTRVMNNPEGASEADLKIVKEFAGIE